MRSFLVILMASTLALSTAMVTGCAADEQSTGAGEDDITGSDRAALMDSLRAKIKPDLANQDIVFNVSGESGQLKDANGWAWLMGKVELRSGGEPKTQGTIYEEDARDGLMDGFHIEALMHKVGGRWTVVESGIGSTDVWYWGIWERYSQAPREIFGPMANQQIGEEASPTERMAIMNGLRAKVKPEAGNQDILFNVKQGGMFRMGGGYAWIQGKVQLRDGRDPKTEGTAYADAAREGLFDGWRVEALLKKQGSKWVVLKHGIGSTDVWYVGLGDEYPAAKPILPQSAGGDAPND
jgi:hypothetical protein